ncbi:hypothetical protein [Zhihengliuella salsuginis]|uniref:Thioredoxin family protein n=1 Tax=Zhihengliuella salsuginis TaxID=578222 RepID=A0ABQ3GGT2_9MICC|nr:hypothetical protein [Zhihengliuella salsuginis]GHD05009.1 hypothetical protein GCM10008096_13240 [Zhihengliuella salsuginis]
MLIKVLHIEDCPMWREAARNTETALRELGAADVDFADTLISTPQEAATSGFAGSPTITVDGRDLFADGARTDALACRVYTEGGSLTGAPSPAAIRAALEPLVLRRPL